MRLLILLISIILCVTILNGCCPDIENDPDEIYLALTRNDLTTFIDSAGNHEQILLVETGTNRVYDEWNDCSVEGYAQVPYAEFELLHSKQSMSYDQLYGKGLTLPGIKLTDMHYGGGWNQSFTIQGYEYSHCNHYGYADSLQEYYSVIIDLQFGLVLFSKANQYRWERVQD